MKHPFYELDQAILKYLNTTLEKELGEPFKYWVKTCKEGAQWEKEITKEMGWEMLSCSGEDLTLQEQLVPTGAIWPRRNKAWTDLIRRATPTQKKLCELYQIVFYDLTDMENMELAIQIAEASGNELHIKKVRNILDMDEGIEPTWW